MSQSTLIAGIRQLRGKLALHGRCEESDEQLLQSFLRCRDDSAFAALVRRHGSMVFHVCRRILGHHQDAEDAFQATFLAFAQQAASLRERTSLAGFLHGIAVRTALKARQSVSRRRKYEGRMFERSSADPVDELLWREVRMLLDEEIARLPEIYRGAFVLCCLQGISGAEAARRLGIKEGTLSSRLTAARKLLQRRLARRGVELTAVLAAVAVATPSASALPPGLIAATTKAALAVSLGHATPAGISAPVAELMQRAAPAMMLSKTKIATAVLLAIGVLAGAGWWRTVGVNRLAQASSAGSHRPLAPAPTPRQTKSEEIHGRVLDPDGRAVKDARLHWPRSIKKNSPKLPDAVELVERGRSDEKGHFRIKLPVSEDLHDFPRKLIVTASGYGLNWVELPRGKSSGELTVRLSKDVAIQGRVVSTEGRPLAGMRVRVDHLEEMPNGKLDQYLAYWEQDWNKAEALKMRWLEIPIKQSILPPAITDQDGRFQLSGVGSERIVHLEIRGKGIAHDMLPIVARSGFDPSTLNKSARNRSKMMAMRIREQLVLHGPSFTYVASPERVVEGVVREAGSGKPIPGVRIHGSANYRTGSEAITDKNGRYRLEGLPSANRSANFQDAPRRVGFCRVEPPRDSPWMSAVQGLPDSGEGLQPVRVDFTLGRGVVLTGRMIDRSTGKGVVGSVMFNYLPDNKYINKPGYNGFAGSYRTDDEGRFRIKVAPGTGVLEAAAGAAVNPFKQAQFDAEDRKHVTFAADGDFVAADGSIGFLSLHNAVKWLDLAPDAGVVKQDLYLERGATAKVRIQDAKGKPLSGVIVSGIDAIPGHHFQKAYVASKAECTIVALEPQKPRQVIFYHAERRLAATLTVCGDEKEALTVRLAPTATVIGRIRDKDGQPISGAEIEAGIGGLLTSPNLTYLYLSLNRTRLPVRTDKDGRFRLEGVVPEDKFALHVRHRGRYVDSGSRTRKLRIQAGETLDLGDIAIKPAD